MFTAASRRSTKTLLIFISVLAGLSLFAFTKPAFAAGEKYVLSSDDSAMTVSGGAFDELTPQPVVLQKHTFTPDDTAGVFVHYMANLNIKSGVKSNCSDQGTSVAVEVDYYLQGSAKGKGIVKLGACGTFDFQQKSYTSAAADSRFTGDKATTKLAAIVGKTVGVSQGTGSAAPPTSGSTINNKEAYTFNDKNGDSITAKGGFFDQFNTKGVNFTYATAANLGSEFSCDDSSTICYKGDLSTTNCTDTAVILFSKDTVTNATGNVNLAANLQLASIPSGCSAINWKNLWTGAGIVQTPIKVTGTIDSFLAAPGRIDDGSGGADDCDTTDGQGNAKDCGDYVDCGGGALGWIICPVIDGAEHAATLLDNFITDSLDIDVSKVFDVSSCGGDTTNCGPAGYYKAWSAFRIIATAIIVIAGLIMVVSQALGFEFLDAYTVRKVLPRLAIAIIGISLSWPLMKFVVGFFDTVGFDIRELIYAPFSGMQAHIVFTTGLAGVLGAAVGWAVLGAASLTFILTGLLAMLVGFLVLVIRQILLIVIIVAAPLAIACYILPGTQKVWKIWSDNFLGLLMMFPIISAFIAVGHVFSVLALSGNTITSTTGTTTVSQIIGIIAYFIPYFLLPITFRLATGFIGNIAGFVNDRNRGAFDRLKKYRGTKTAENMHNMTTGDRFNNSALNRLTARATTRSFGMGRRGRAALTDKRELAAAEFMKSRHGMATQHNEDVLWAKTYRSAAEANSRLREEHPEWGDARIKQAIAGAKAAGGFGFSQQVFATKQLAATGTGFDNDAQMYATIARVANGNQGSAAAMVGDMRALSERAGRGDLKSSYAGATSFVNRVMEANARSRTGALTAEQLDADAGFSQEMAELGLDAGRGVSSSGLMGQQKPQAVAGITRRANQVRAFHQGRANDTSLDAGQRQYSATRLGQTEALMENMHTAGNSTYTPQVNMEALAGSSTYAPGQVIVDGNREASPLPQNRTVTGQNVGIESPTEVPGVNVHQAAVDARNNANAAGAADIYHREHVTRSYDEGAEHQQNQRPQEPPQEEG